MADEASDIDFDIPADANRFYYLRLMSRRTSASGQPSAVTKPKFVQWGGARRFSTSLEENPDLESQAMKIVRTIGQAFDVCHKISVDEQDHKDKESCELISTSEQNVCEVEDTAEQPNTQAVKSKRSVSEADIKQKKSFDNVGMKQFLEVPGESSLASVSPSPSPSPAPTTTPEIPPLLRPPESQGESRRRVSAEFSTPEKLESPRKSSDTTARYHFANNPPSTSTNIPAAPSSPLLPFSTIASSACDTANYNPLHSLTQSWTWTGSNAGPSVDTGDSFGGVWSTSTSNVAPSLSSPQINPFYDNPTQQQDFRKTSMVSSVLSPMPMASPGLQSSFFPPNDDDPFAFNSESSAARTLGQSVETYSIHLLRTQLDQAQQQAQVAIAQVHLLRNQLSAETTARLESQTRTQQLLNANKELIEQVQALVARLQHLENRLVGDSNAENLIQHPNAQSQPTPASSISLSRSPLRSDSSIGVASAAANLDVPHASAERRSSAASDSSGVHMGESQKSSPSSASPTDVGQARAREHLLKRQPKVGGGDDLNVFKVSRHTFSKEDDDEDDDAETPDVVGALSKKLTFARTEDRAAGGVRARQKSVDVGNPSSFSGNLSATLGKRYSLQVPSSASLFPITNDVGSAERPRSLLVDVDDNGNNLGDKNNDQNKTVSNMDNNNNNNNTVGNKRGLFRFFENKFGKSEHHNRQAPPIENHVGEHDTLSPTTPFDDTEVAFKQKVINKQMSTNSFLPDKRTLMLNDETKKLRRSQTETDYKHRNSLSTN